MSTDNKRALPPRLNLSIGQKTIPLTDAKKSNAPIMPFAESIPSQGRQWANRLIPAIEIDYVNARLPCWWGAHSPTHVRTHTRMYDVGALTNGDK